jgi:hypothetical protein
MSECPAASKVWASGEGRTDTIVSIRDDTDSPSSIPSRLKRR